MNKKFLFSLFALLLFLIPGNSLKADVIYVKDASSAAWSGKASVYTSFTDAYAAAVAGDEIWVAGGEYEITATIAMKDVKIYGGFAGTETSVEERAKVTDGKVWEFVNTSTLKFSTGTNTNMFNATAATTFTLDGMTLDGNKSGDVTARAIQVTFNSTAHNINITNNVVQNFKIAGDGGAFNIRYPGVTIAGCLITNNEANKGAGGYFDNGAVIRDCEITNNSIPTGLATTAYQGNQSGAGGGLLLANTGSGVKVYNCYIAGNSAYFGGGVHVRDKSTIYNSIIVNNTSSLSGSGVSFEGRDNGGSVYNCIIANNTSEMEGGAGVVFTATTSGDKVQKLQNSVLYNNTDNASSVVNIASVATGGGATKPVISNNILDKVYTELSAYTTATVIGSDPANLFTNLSNENYEPSASFIGVDQGNATGLVFATGLDYAGENRIQGVSIDIGAYEYTPTAQLVNLTKSNVTTTPGSLTSVATGGNISLTFTVNAGYHSPYVSVNNTKVEPVKNGSVYTLEILNVVSTQNIEIAAFAPNVLPVSEDTYQRYTTDAAAGHDSDYYADSKIYESRSNYAAIPLLQFVPTDEMKTAGYNVAKLKLVPTATTLTGDRKYTVRQLAGTAYESLTIYELPWNNNGTEIRKGTLIGAAAQEITVAQSTPFELDVSDDYILDFPNLIRFSIDTDNASITSLHSLENGNSENVPVLIFDIYPEVSVNAADGVTLVSPAKAGPYAVAPGTNFVLQFSVDEEVEPIVKINGEAVESGQLVLNEGVYTLTISNVLEDAVVTITTLSTGLGNVNDQQVQLLTEGRSLKVITAKTALCEVYSLTGSLVAKQNIESVGTMLLEKGSYIVKIDNEAYKVIIR